MNQLHKLCSLSHGAFCLFVTGQNGNFCLRVDIKPKPNYNSHLVERPDSQTSSQHLTVTTANMADLLSSMAPPCAFHTRPSKPQPWMGPTILFYFLRAPKKKNQNCIILQTDATKIQVFNLRGTSASGGHSFVRISLSNCSPLSGPASGPHPPPPRLEDNLAPLSPTRTEAPRP